MIIDLRDYTLKPDTRNRFVACCEAVIFPEQERLGATILGIFRDTQDPNRIVWLRSMPDMAERKRILTAFYAEGEVWRANHRKVNSWLVDSHNVLLVRPDADMAPPATDASIVSMYSCLRPEPFAGDEVRDVLTHAVRDAGGRLLVELAVDASENNFPRHPIRTGEFGFVWFATFEPGLHRHLGLAAVAERTLLPTQQSRLR